MKIVSNTGGLAQTNAFLIADEHAKQAVIFDAPDHTLAPLVNHARAQGWEIVGLWLTHGHFDHIADHLAVTDAFPNAKVLIHRDGEAKLLDPTSKMFTLPFKIAPRNADGYVAEGDRLKIGSIEFKVIDTPGHCVGHVGFYCAAEKILVGGDLIIGGSVGRTDLPDSDHDALLASIRNVMKLPGDVTLLGGHGAPSTLADEMANNPYVRQALRRN